MGLAKNIKDQKSGYLSVEELFLGDRRYIIPSFQRPYSWKREQVDDLFSSFKELCDASINDSTSDYGNYLGTLILARDINNQARFEVVDGQQRITTFILFINAIISLVKKEYSQNLVNYSNISKDIEEFLTKFQNMKFKKDIRLTEVNKDKNIVIEHFDKRDKTNFQDILTQKEVSYKNNRINKNYLEITRRIEEITKDGFESVNVSLSKIDILIYFANICISKSYVLQTELRDVENAFAIFESINTTGLQLTPFDLINGYINSKLNILKLEQLNDEWNAKISMYRSEDIKLNDFIFYWMNSKESINNISLFSETKKYIEKNGVEKSVNEIIEVFDALKIFLFESNSYVSMYIHLLKRKKIIAIYVLLFQKKYSQDNILSFMTKLIKYSVIELNLLGKSPGTFQYKLQSIIKYITNRNDNNDLKFEECIDSISTLKLDFTSYNREVFDALETGKLVDVSLFKALLLMILEDEQKSFILRFETVEAEHVFPQKPAKEWYSDSKWKLFESNDDAREKITNKIGNIIILDKKINKQVSNKYIEEKRKDIEQKLDNNDILKNSDWNKIAYDKFSPKYIDERTSKIIEILLKKNLLFEENI